MVEMDAVVRIAVTTCFLTSDGPKVTAYVGGSMLRDNERYEACAGRIERQGHPGDFQSQR